MNNKIVRGMKKIWKNGLYGTIKNYNEKKETQKILLDTVRKYHMISESEREEQKRSVFADAPCISIITPLYNTPISFLEELLKSVQNQTYENWEFCLADGSDEEHTLVGKICREYAAKDVRIKYKKLEKNDGIVGNTNQAVRMASGAYCGMLDHDDLLHESALYECVKEIQKGADFIYTDEMKFSEDPSMSTDIVCKSGFGKDELRSHNYICHFVVFKKSLLDGMKELYRKECEGSQDYDMVLRLTERAKKVSHIPKILYYWRVHAGSVAMDLSVKQYAVDAAKSAITGQLERSGETGTVECNFPYETIYRIRYDIKEKPVVSIYLWGEEKAAENWEKMKEQMELLLKKTSYRPLEIILPLEKTPETIPCEKMLKEQVKLITCEKNQKENWYGWMKRAGEKGSGDYRICLNHWCYPKSTDWIEEMLMYAMRNDVGVVGAKIMDNKENICFGGAVLDRDSANRIHVVNAGLPDREQGYEANMRHVRNTSILTGICMMVSEKHMEELEDFEEAMDGCADADLCMRSKEKGLWNVWDCFAEMYYTGKNSIDDFWNENKNWQEKWKKQIEQVDEYYHPLLKQLKKM